MTKGNLRLIAVYRPTQMLEKLLAGQTGQTGEKIKHILSLRRRMMEAASTCAKAQVDFFDAEEKAFATSSKEDQVTKSSAFCAAGNAELRLYAASCDYENSMRELHVSLKKAWISEPTPANEAIFIRFDEIYLL